MSNRKPSSQGTISIFEPLEGRRLLSAAYTGVPAAVPGVIQAEDFDTGSSGDAYYDTTSGNSGKVYRSTNVDVGGSNDTGGGYTLAWVKAGEWLKYTITVPETGTYRLDTRLAAPGTGGTFRVEFAGVDKTGTISVPGTGSWNNWTTLSKEVSLTAGTYVMRVVMLKNGSSGYVGNFNWFALTSVEGGPVEPPPPEPVPAAPSSLAVGAISASQINLTWTDNASNETGFRIDRSTDGSNWSQLATMNAGATSYSATGLSASTRYYFRVYAYNSVGKSAFSNTVSATTAAAPGSAAYPSGTPWAMPGRVEAENFDNGGQNVAYFDTTSGNSGGVHRTDDVDVGGSNDTDGGYTLGWVKAGEWVNYTVSVGQSGLYRLDTRVASQGAGGTFRVEFNGVDKTGTISVPNTGSWGSWATVSQDVSLEAGVYVMRVRMLSDGSTGHVGNFNWFELTPTTPVTEAPAAPGNLAASVASSSQINLNWQDSSSSEAGFRVERSTNGSTWTQIATLGANITTYSATGLSAGTTYYFRVHAYNAVGASAWSNTASGKTLTATQVGERPGAHNTGPTNPSILQNSGGISSSAHGQVIQNVNVSGVIYINHNNVTVRNFRIDAGGASYAVRIANGVTGTVFEDGEAYNFGAAFCYQFINYTARRLNIHHSQGDGFKAEGNVVIESCWIHHLGTGVGAHADGIQVAKGSNMVFRGNFFDMPINVAGTASNAAIFLNCGLGPTRDVLIEQNWMNGGNYTLHLDASTGGNVVVRDNFFGRDYRYGIYRAWGDVTWTNNRFWDNSALIA